MLVQRTREQKEVEASLFLCTCCLQHGGAEAPTEGHREQLDVAEHRDGFAAAGHPTKHLRPCRHW